MCLNNQKITLYINFKMSWLIDSELSRRDYSARTVKSSVWCARKIPCICTATHAHACKISRCTYIYPRTLTQARTLTPSWQSRMIARPARCTFGPPPLFITQPRFSANVSHKSQGVHWSEVGSSMEVRTKGEMTVGGVNFCPCLSVLRFRPITLTDNTTKNWRAIDHHHWQQFPGLFLIPSSAWRAIVVVLVRGHLDQPRACRDSARYHSDNQTMVRGLAERIKLGRRKGSHR